MSPAAASPKTRASAASKTRMNSRPMILRFSSGSWMPSRAPRNWSLASTMSRRVEDGLEVACAPARSRRAASSRGRRTRTSAGCRSRAARSPPPRPSPRRPTARRSPAVTDLLADRLDLLVDDVEHRPGRPAPAISSRKCSSTCWPCSVCSTSGCHCTPAKPRPTSSNAPPASRPSMRAAVKPSGAAVTESPCDIQTLWWAGMPASSVPPRPR